MAYLGFSSLIHSAHLAKPHGHCAVVYFALKAVALGLKSAQNPWK